jgi:hypothetical protein
VAANPPQRALSTGPGVSARRCHPRSVLLALALAMLAVLDAPGAQAQAAELVWQPQPLSVPDLSYDQFSVAIGQGAIGRVGYRFTTGGTTRTCWQQVLTSELCPRPRTGIYLEQGVATSSNGQAWYTELASDGRVTWQAPDGRNGAFPSSAAGDERIYPHSDGSADLSWYSGATHQWFAGTIAADQTAGEPADPRLVATDAGNFGRFWTACPSPSSTLVLSTPSLSRLPFVRPGFGFPAPGQTIPGLPSGTSGLRVWCQTLPDGVAFAYSYTTDGGRREEVEVGRLDTDARLLDLEPPLTRPRDPAAVSDKLVGFFALGSRWYLVYSNQATADSAPRYFYRGSSDAGQSWSDWSEMTAPTPTDESAAVLGDGRLAWLSRADGVGLWAYPELHGNPPAHLSVLGTNTASLEAAPACEGDRAPGLPSVFSCGGDVLIKLRGSRRFVPLTGETPISSGAVVDASRAAVTVTVAGMNGERRSGTFAGGVFTLMRPDHEHAAATIVLTGRLTCGGKAGTSKRRPKKASPQRDLWADAQGGFTTRGSFVAATELGTRWLTEDRCDGSLVQVEQGAVRVRNLRTKRTLTVPAGHSYFAAARRGGRRS